MKSNSAKAFHIAKRSLAMITMVPLFFCHNETTLAQGGKVGINTSSPQATLNVLEGDVLFNSADTSGIPAPPPVSGAGVRMMWYPDKAALRAGKVTGTSWNKDSIGLFSVAMGLNTRAKGIGSIAVGSNNRASGNYSAAFGTNNVATGLYSTAFGAANDANGTHSFAVGFNCLASGNFSVAMGNNSKAAGGESIAVGYFSNALGFSSTAFGFATTAASYGASAFGIVTHAKGLASTAIGRHTQANGYASTVIGLYNDTLVSPQTSVQTTTPLFIIGNGDEEAPSNALIVRKDGLVGLGTNAPAKRLHVSEGPSNALIVNSSVALFENDGVVNIGLLAPSGYPATINFGNEISSTHGAIEYNGTLINGLTFRANNANRMVLTSNGRLGLGTTSPDVIFEASGTGDQNLRINSTNAADAGMQFLRTGSGADWHIMDSVGNLFFSRSTDDLLTETPVLRLTTQVLPGADDANALG